jgi:predicted nucleic acid-binding protein
MDTSALYALFNREDDHHQVVEGVRDTDAGPYFVPSGILAEVAYMTETYLKLEVLEDFLLDLEEQAYLLDCGADDFSRIRQLIRRYQDLPLGFADAAVVACAERHGGRVLTTDHRDFDVVARGERTITILPRSLTAP